jgi:hypothetical protein
MSVRMRGAVINAVLATRLSHHSDGFKLASSKQSRQVGRLGPLLCSAARMPWPDSGTEGEQG